MICPICNIEYTHISTHIRRAHKLEPKIVYDKYFQKDNEHICPVCGKETTFLGLTKGYRKHCSTRCSSLNPESQQLARQTRLEKYGDENYSLFGSKMFIDNQLAKQGERLNTFGSKSYILSMQKKYPDANILLTDNPNQISAKISNCVYRKCGYNSNSEALFARKLTEKSITFIHNYKDSRYPWKCDFYLSDYDIFIELQLNHYHNYRPYTEKDYELVQQLKNGSADERQIYKTWVMHDVKRRNIAKQNNLHYFEFFTLESALVWIEQEIDV